MKKVLITGITGFAGSHLAELLVSKNEFEVFGTHVSDRNLNNLTSVQNKVKLFKVNLIDQTETTKVITEVRPDVIYHLAASTSVAESFKNPSAVITNNTASQINVLESVKDLKLNNTKIIITSSAHVYGQIALDDLPIDENTPFKPDNPYAVSKITQDYLGLSYFLGYQLQIIMLRPFNHVGPRLSPDIALSSFAKAIVEIEKGKTEPVLRVGNMTTKRDFTDVKDMVRAYYLASEHCIPGEAYNIGTGESHTMQSILDLMLNISKTKIEVVSDPAKFRPSDLPELRCDVRKFQQATGWKPEAKLADSLQEMLDYWRKVV